MNVSLVMVTSDGKSKEIPLGKLPANIGRGEDCKVRVPLPSVSRKHCELLVDQDEEFSVKDLNSSNGTFVNGERVRAKELVPGDLLAIGPVVFVVRIDGHPKEIDPVESYAAGAVAVGGGGEAPADRRTQMIEGVPSWSGQAGVERAKEAAEPTKPSGAPKSNGGAGDGGDGDKDFLGSILDDFDFGEEDEEEKKK